MHGAARLLGRSLLHGWGGAGDGAGGGGPLPPFGSEDKVPMPLISGTAGTAAPIPQAERPAHCYGSYLGPECAPWAIAGGGSGVSPPLVDKRGVGGTVLVVAMVVSATIILAALCGTVYIIMLRRLRKAEQQEQAALKEADSAGTRDIAIPVLVLGPGRALHVAFDDGHSSTVQAAATEQQQWELEQQQQRAENSASSGGHGGSSGGSAAAAWVELQPSAVHAEASAPSPPSTGSHGSRSGAATAPIGLAHVAAEPVHPTMLPAVDSRSLVQRLRCPPSQGVPLSFADLSTLGGGPMQ